MLTIAMFALVATRGRGLLEDISQAPRDVVLAYAAWALLCVASLAWSEHPGHTAAELRAEMLYGTLAFALFHLAAKDAARWRQWWVALLAGTVTVAAASILQQLLPVPLSRHPLDGGPGPWSTHLVLVAPLLLAIAWPRPWGQDRGAAVQAVALLALLLAAWETENRIVWAAFGLQLAIIATLRRASPALDGVRGRRLRMIALVATLTIAVAFVASIVERNHRLFPANAPVTTGLERDSRPALWAAAWKEFIAAPWLGHGFGREILQEKFLPLTPPTPGHPPLQHAHNVFIDMALQVGAVGLAAFVFLLASMARRYVGFLRRPEVAPLGIIGLALIAGFLVKCLTDDFLHRHNGLVFWAVNGMLLALGQRAKAPA